VNWGGKEFTVTVDEQGVRVQEVGSEREIWIDPHKMNNPERGSVGEQPLQVHVYVNDDDKEGAPSTTLNVYSDLCRQSK
jgi:hypothetical protein